MLINWGKSAPQAAHTDIPWKIVNSCLPLGFHWQLFLRTRPWHHQQTNIQKLPVGTRCWSSFIFRNGSSKMWEQTTLWHCARKSARHVLKFFTDQLKKARQMRFSTAGYTCSTQTRVIFDPAVWKTIVKCCSKYGVKELAPYYGPVSVQYSCIVQYTCMQI